MEKKQITTTIDPVLYKKAKEHGFKFSILLENAIRERIELLEAPKREGKGCNSSKKCGPGGIRTLDLRLVKAGSEYLPNSNVPAQSAEEFLYDFEETLRHEWEQSEWTIRSRIPIAKKLVDFLGDHPFTASRRDLREFLKVNGTQNAYKTIRVIYGRYFDTDLADGFKIPQSVVKPKRIPKDEEIKNCFYKLKNQELKACYLVLATSGIRRGELLSLTIKDIDLENKTIYPKGSGSTKKQWVSFYNEEAEPYILDLIDSYERGSIVRISRNHITKSFRKASKGKITPKVLREWFADKMGRLGVPDRYIDAFAAESHDRSWQGTTLTSQPGS